MTANNLDALTTSLEAVRSAADAAIDAATTLEELHAVEESLTGRDSDIAAARRGLGKMEHADRPTAGKYINEIAVAVQGVIDGRRVALEQSERNARLAAETIDVTLDYAQFSAGTIHPIQQVMDEVADIFVGLGYRVVEGPEAELASYNFDALNTPPDHPARMESDTMYVDDPESPDPAILMRTQTSPLQVRSMEQQPPPIFVVAPGAVYRNDSIDATHLPVFHQIEGLAVDVGITFSDLKGTLIEFARRFFGPDIEVRLRPHFFPFTEPSAELDVLWGDQWLEMLGCGMVDPAVFEAVGYDPDEVTGFAFGMGIERLAMVRHKIDSIRHFVDNDVRFLGQFAG